MLVDTSVWSLALRRDVAPRVREVQVLSRALVGEETVVTTGLIVQELLQGFTGPKAHEEIIRTLSLLPVIHPELDDHIGAAALRNRCRREGVQVGTIDAILAQLCIRHGLLLLTADRDFLRMTKHCKLELA